MVKSACLKPLDTDIKSVLDKMITISEDIAKKLGAPWLRVDFFVGGEQGLRVNELAYGSGLWYPPNLNDDVVTIMYEGMVNRKYLVNPWQAALKDIGCSLEEEGYVNTVQCGKISRAGLARAFV
mmetsp:Transcript_117105/g.292126  ORF Transcript_117105/g.292126 Transcript_117105/m.292126 type:complete len:124 (+) Transcript_117105:80-451(+)